MRQENTAGYTGLATANSSYAAGDGRPHSFPGELSTIMAGLACGDPSPVAWDLLWDHADAFVATPDYVVLFRPGPEADADATDVVDEQLIEEISKNKFHTLLRTA